MASTAATAEAAPTANSIKDFDSGLASCYNRLRETFARGHTKPIQWRKWQLKQLWWMIEDNQDKILDALTDDLGRHEMESRASDLLGLKMDILEHIKHVEAWAATRPVPDAGFLFGRLGKARIRMEPLGVVLIIGAWNFPFLLTLQPVIAAVAAGCCIVIKPSELAANSERVMANLVASYLDQSAIRLVTGGPDEAAKILKYRFDHIFFTGSAKVARFITAAAAQNLTPTTLELGGQCPAIVTKTANIDLAAKRIAAVKFQNAGQICLSVNHVFADPSIYDQFLARLEYWTRRFAATGQMCHIINERNRDRLVNMLRESRGRFIQCGDNKNRKSNERTYLDPVIVADVSPSDAIMSEELFGPICPVIKATMEQAAAITNNLPRPLAIYIFSSDKSEMDRLQDSTLSGGVTINDATMHAGVPNAPFGGVGDSGMGFYHGKYGFLAFTHQRTVVELPTWLDKVMGFRYPPFNIANRSKLSISNRNGFQRGETVKNQQLSYSSSSAIMSWRTALLTGALAYCLYWLANISKPRLLVLEMIKELQNRFGAE